MVGDVNDYPALTTDLEHHLTIGAISTDVAIGFPRRRHYGRPDGLPQIFARATLMADHHYRTWATSNPWPTVTVLVHGTVRVLGLAAVVLIL